MWFWSSQLSFSDLNQVWLLLGVPGAQPEKSSAFSLFSPTVAEIKTFSGNG